MIDPSNVLLSMYTYHYNDSSEFDARLTIIRDYLQVVVKVEGERAEDCYSYIRKKLKEGREHQALLTRIVKRYTVNNEEN